MAEHTPHARVGRVHPPVAPISPPSAHLCQTPRLSPGADRHRPTASRLVLPPLRPFATRRTCFPSDTKTFGHRSGICTACVSAETRPHCLCPPPTCQNTPHRGRIPLEGSFFPSAVKL